MFTRLLHDPGHAQLVHLRHGEHLHPQQLQDVAEDGHKQRALCRRADRHTGQVWTGGLTAQLDPRPSDRCRPDPGPTHTAPSRRSMEEQESVKQGGTDWNQEAELTFDLSSQVDRGRSLP